jgi:hypothetical protein
MLGGTAFSAPATVYASAHTADPGLTGANEVTGTGYARAAISWAAASVKAKSSNAAVSITFPNTGGPWNVPFAGIWDASSSGNFLFRVPLLGTTIIAAGQASTDLFTSYGHGLAADDRVFIDAGGGQGLPSGITAGTVYYVLASGLTTDAFKVSATSGGTAVDLTTDGEGIFRKVLVKPMNATDVLQLTSGQLTVNV